MRCSFELDRNDPIYFAGEKIKGRALLTTKSTQSFCQIFILFVGEGKVRFRACDKGESAHVVFRGRQIFVDSQTNVMQSRTLPAGTHTVSFDISVPPDCPTSVVTEFGKIWYEIKLCILKVGVHSIQKFKKPLTVLQTCNLNMRPELLIPLVQEDIQDFCCWPCMSGSVLLTLTIPFGGYAPGQKIPFNLEVDNQSSRRDLVGMKMRLKQIFKVKANNPRHYSYKVEHFVAQSYQKAKVLRLSKKVIEGTLTIPAVSPSSRNNNGIISVSYEAHLTVDLDDCQTHPDLYLPIVIGTIPLIQSAEDPTYVAELIAQTEDLPPSYDNYSPPTFEEAIIVGNTFIDTDEDAENRTDGFIPRYPMYSNFGSTPPSNTEEPSSTLL